MKSVMWIMALCTIGLLVALTALYYHYDDDSSKFCDISKKFSCSTVYKSEWSNIFGLPVPILGVFGYVGFAVLVWFRKIWTTPLGFTEKDAWWYLSLIASAMFLYQTFMTGLEVVGIIPAVCVLCLVSQTVVIGLVFLSWRNWWSVTR